MLRSLLATVAMLLAACGSGGSDSGSTSAPGIAEFLLYGGTCDLGSKDCGLWIKGALAGDPSPEFWEIGFTLTQGYASPECTVDNSYKLQNGHMLFPLKVPSGTTWTARGCVWNIGTQTFHESTTSTTTLPTML